MTLGITSAWADDLSGTYYIANDANHAAAINTRWYLVPGADPQKSHYADAYFNNEYCNKSGKGDYTGTNYGDPEKPFLTTYQTNQDLNSIWIISSAGDGSYYIKHAKTGKYIIYEPPYKDAPQRKSMHLESTETPGENAKFTITGSLSGPININPKSVTSGNKYFNPATGVGNRPYYYGTGGDYLHDGMIGLWSASDGNSRWYLEKTVIPPTISYDEETGNATITSVTGTTIHYAFDDTTPTGSSATYSDPVPMAEHTIIKAIAVDAQGTTSNVVTLTLKDYTYHILHKDKTEAIRATKRQVIGKQLSSSYTDIPAAIRSPYLDGESITFYNDADCAEEHKISETPSATSDIYVRYTTDLDGKFLHLRGARAMNLTIYGDYISDNEGSFAHKAGATEDEKMTRPYLWYFSGEDPYAIEIRNAQTNNYIGYTTPSTLSLGAAPTNKKFILMSGAAAGDGEHYEQMELMAATGDDNYYRISRSGNVFSLSTTTTGDATLQVTAAPNSSSATYNLVDQAGKIILTKTGKLEDVAVPTEWVSPMVGTYNYWKIGAFDIYGTGDNQVYKLKDNPEAYRITTPTDVDDGMIYITYEVNNTITFDISDNDVVHNELYPAYRLKFYGGENFLQENGKDGLDASAQKAEYPYSNGDAMLYVYSEAKRETQFNSGASTRARWLWYAVSPQAAKVNTGSGEVDVTPGYKGDPYHVKIMSYSAQASSHNYFRTYVVNYGGSNHVVTGVTTKNSSVSTLDPEHPENYQLPTEYMILSAPNNRYKLVTVDEISDGTTTERRTVNTFEQYWKNNPTVQNRLGDAKVAASESTTDDGIELTPVQASLLTGWHTYKAWANAAPWVSWSDASGSGKQYHNKHHWFQTIDMGSTGEFTFEATTLEPEVILLDNHGWEIMRMPLSDAAQLKKYDSPMVETYHWYPTAAKVTGYHKYNVSDPEITVYYSYEEGGKTKWGDSGNHYTHTSKSLADNPYLHFTENGWEEQPSSVKTDFYVTYDVSPAYAHYYSGAATEEAAAATASAFWVKQGDDYAYINESNHQLTTTTDPTTLPDTEVAEWYVKPNFNIDVEMGYQYDVEEDDGAGGTYTPTPAQKDAKNYEEGRNGFDPYNVQFQNVKNEFYYLKVNTTGSHLAGDWEGTSSNLSLQNLHGEGTTQENVDGYEHTKLSITNATFMVVKDESGHMLLMPRFDHTKVVNSFTDPYLSAPNAATQTLELTMAPKVIHNSNEFAALNGQYTLASDFTFDEDFESLGTSDYPFTGSIDGGLHPISTDPETPLTTPLIAYADGAIIKNIILDNVNITTDGNAGAIVSNATGETRIYNCGINSGSVGGSGNVGGIVGNLHGEEITVDGKKKYIGARVINCYSYANVTSGTNVGGIVGYNDFESTASKIATMVMNCMFYGDITGGSTVSPVYGGLNINNLNSGGLNTFNYYAYDELKSSSISKYNCALAIEEKNLKRFEFYRLLLNSNRRLAAYYASSSAGDVHEEDMMKFVLETADRSIAEPKSYPVLKAQDYYPSIINYDVENAPDSASVGRNHGGKLGRTLSVTINQGSGAPDGASITNGSLSLQRTDKDFDRFNFNYDKVQLPYYNDVGTKNYTGNKVVTGWKITAITAVDGDPYTSTNYPTSGIKDFPDHNYADRKSSNKDLYSVSKRVFSQGAYFDVPYGVTSITIEPYWGNAVYVADEYLDVVYNTGYTAQSVTQLGKTFPSQKITINDSEQDVYTSISAAIKDKSSSSVYDLAVVLVGNLHQGDVPSKGSMAFTIMSVDLNHDNEPDYSMIYHHNNRQQVCPIRFDFINIPGTAQAQKPNGADKLMNFTIFLMKGWFETTNTCIVYSNQVEYENKQNSTTKVDAPLILLGGDFEQFVSTRAEAVAGKTYYIHVGGNVKIDNFGLGTHSDGKQSTPHVPVSVTGGEFKGFYLTGTYNPNAIEREDNAECYISGGHFVEAAGACQEPINGDVHWQIYDADIDAFYGGGINDARPIKGTITTDIYNSHVTLFCGGPKFGNMTAGKAVTTNAEGCVFDEYFGAGYGGLSYSRQKYIDESGFKFGSNPYTGDKEKYFDGQTTNANNSHADYGKKGPGVAIDFDYEFFVWSTGVTGARMYVKFASFSLAQCDNVFSNLKECTVNHNFYGGGSLGKVVGKATSVLDGCTVHGNVFGGGYSGTLPTLEVRDGGFTKIPIFNSNSGMFEPGEFSGTTIYTWKNAEEAGVTLTNGGEGSDKTKHYIYTNQNLTVLGQVGETDLTIKGNTSVTGNVFGGGDESAISASATATGNTKVTIEKNDNNETPTVNNVYGGGNTADVEGNTEVEMTNGTVSQDIYGGGKGQTTVVGGNVEVNIGPKENAEKPLSVRDVYGGSALGAVNTTQNTETGKYDKTTTVNVYGGTVTGSVYGGGRGDLASLGDGHSDIDARNFGPTSVNMEGGTVSTAVYGGSNVNGVLKDNAAVTITGGTIGDSENQNRNVVFGGGFGAPTLVNGNVTMNIGEEGQTSAGAIIYGHVYGGGALGSTNEAWVTDTSTDPATTTLQPVANTKTLVNLLKGTINGYAYGGALGSAETPAYVGGDVTVTLDGAKVQQVFGANNINGTPKGHVKVHVKRTVDSDKSSETALAKTREQRTTYDVEAVYGGGNKADYIPTDAANGFAEVLIEGCEKTSIQYVYGGGNAAAVPATDVTIKGSYIIDKVYGGGNGAGFMDPPTNNVPNPGANVGIHMVGETPTNYGTGKAETKLLGGYINDVYGGSNTKGDVRGGTDVRTKGKTEVVTGDCCTDLNVGNIYGAGSHADVKGDVNIILECMPKDFVDAVYGGAEEATVEGNVTLTVTSGKFGRVFGGNNKGGDIHGSITVNVYEDGCKPLIIGEVYGGGNAAPYSIFGCTNTEGTWSANTTGTKYFDEATAGRAAIQVNVVACTSVGKVFGGGMGETAKVIGNTHVDINLMKGIVDGTKQSTIGKIAQVFGGGGLADVKGNTLVDIGTILAYDGEENAIANGVNITKGTYTSSTEGTYLNPEADAYFDMPSAGVYGGGSEADVDGNTTVNIGTKNLPLGVNIEGDIFGGGYGAATHVTGDVVVNIGKRTETIVNEVTTYDYEGYAQITGDVYGGSAQGKVNSYLNSSEETASEGKTTHVNFYGGTITGNIHGGGLGDLASLGEGHANVAADVYGPVTVTMEKGSNTNTVVNNVFGCNNYLGTPKNTVTVNVNGGTVNHSVYGGGNQAAYTPTSSINYPAVNIISGTVTENVFGGGLGLTATVTANPHVTIGDNVEGHTVTILKSVYGGGSLASVDGSTNIVVNKGTIGTEGEGGATYGNIYGGGFGSNDNVRIGIVKGNTNITVNGGSVLHNVYGGGAYGSVGTYTYASEAANAAISALATANTGKATITVLGGTIGTTGYENGMIFGASRGDINRPDAIQDNMAWVYETDVVIGQTDDATDGPQIKGSLYGSGENGHTYQNAKVTIHSGKIGITEELDSDPVGQKGAYYPYRGNVYGGGCGTDKYYANPEDETHDGHGTLYNIKAGIVGGTATVTIDGGHVVRNVYGGGAMGSVTGGTQVNISGNSVIGADGSGGGYVYAAARGYEDMAVGYAAVGSTALNISGGTIWQSAFGGGQLGTVKGSVAVTVSGGVVKNDVYGGGALANTNTDNWNAATDNWSDTNSDTYYAEVKHLKKDESSVDGYYTRSGASEPYTYSPASGLADGTSKYYKKLDGFLNVAANGTAKTTTVNLTGGTIGNAYGGGLGQLEKAAVYYTAEDAEVIAGTKNVGDVKTPAVTAVEAMVYGDISVTVNGTKFTKETERVDGKAIPVTGRVFGCNNLNGTPKGSVLVHVISTHRLDDGAHVKNQFEIQGVYGGGNMSHYVPKTYDNATEFGQHTKVIIDGCDNTSIERVYGGGNASNVPLTDVTIEGAFQIGYVFGGGNGGDKINKGTGAGWESNPGANVLPGYTNVVLHGGTIGEAFGGSDSKGIVGGSELTQDAKPDCPLVINNMYGASKEAETDNDVILNLAGCENSVVDKVFGGSYNADVRGNITINVYNGIYTSIFGGNDRQGTIGGNITINVEEVDECMPIIIQNLVGGGSQADYPGVDSDGNPAKAFIGPTRGIKDHPESYKNFTSGNITINVKAATRIDRIFGGCDNAAATGNTTVNINMVKGSKAGDPYTLPEGYTGNAIPNLVGGYIKDEIGTIGYVYGGGNEGDVIGNSAVNICTEKDITFTKLEGHVPAHLTPNDAGKYDVLGAHIYGDVFGAGNNGNVTGNATVNICTADYSGTTGFEGVSIGESVYGGGSAADVLGNTFVTMSGGNRTEVDGAYVYDGIYGGGLMGSVGTAADGEGNVIYHTGTEAHAGCIGKIVNYKANTGKCTVVVTGGQVGPKEVALADGGMKNTARYFKDPEDPKDVGPVDVGFVFGAGRGEVEDPATDKDADFRTFVKETDVTIGGTAFIMASVYGGGENGRVANDTHVTISGGQIGCGEGKVVDGKPVPYTDDQWAGENASNFTECASWDFKSPYWPHDPYGGDDAGVEGTDGHTYYGNVFGGGSGYYPYKKADGTHDWLRSAGQVYGNTVIDITGGHILTSVYGGNETTDVGTYTKNDKGFPVVWSSGGKCTINMVGGTIGVPRTEQQMKDHPVTCYLFGAGKGDQRTHFNTWTNVQETEVNVSGTARIFGSVFGGGEDGHILGNANVNIGGTVKIDLNGNGDTDDSGETFTADSEKLKIGTTGTSYVDGNIFGGGRGFSGEALTAGSTGGNVTMNITGGTMLGSVYGGGRLASVGIGFTAPEDVSYGQLNDDTTSPAKQYGHISINISGGTIGTTTEAGSDHPVGGNVFGGSMGRITLLDGTLNPLWPKMAVVKLTNVTISGGEIMNNVYGGSEYGIVRNRATINMTGGTVRGNVFGGGYGSEDDTKIVLKVGGYANTYYTFTPTAWTGCVSGSTFVNISGGKVAKNVYGGGDMASVGLIDFVSDAKGNFTKIIKHESLTDGFGLSWPYEYTYHAAAPNDLPAVGGGEVGAKATVTVTGGRIGGSVFGGCKGGVSFKGMTDITQQRYTEASMANVRETEVNINYSETPASTDGSTACIVGRVYGGGQDGHVYENAAVNITGGLIGQSVYGGGEGESTYKGKLRDQDNDNWKSETEDLMSWTAGKVYGNTSVTMSGGHVMINVYGGGHMASVGKGNYAGGADDYYPAGYGEKITGNLWTSTDVGDYAWHFLNSGKATVKITGGTVGSLNGVSGTVFGTSDPTPTGMVFGGSRGQAAQDVTKNPRYEYAPNFYLGYVNETEVTIGQTDEEYAENPLTAPRIYSQVFGGGRDGHVRNSTHVIVNRGTIGQSYSDTKAAGGATADYQRYHRGNVYGSGSGLGVWNDGTNHGMSSGSVTRNTTVDIYGGTIYNNVYGGGALSSVGPPKITMPDYAPENWSKCTVNIHGGTIGDADVYDAHQYGGCVYGASRGNDFAEGESPENFATVLWTKVNINGGDIAGNVYGGAKGGLVWKDTEVNLQGGTIAHNAYGGGQGTSTIAANIGGNTTVKLNEGKGANDSGCMVEKVFGCNDLNGTPRGHALVHVYATQHKNTAKIVPTGGKYAKFESMEGGYSITNYSGLTTLAAATGTDVSAYTAVLSGEGTEDEKKTALANMIEAIADKKYDVLAVYGGGDLAMYEPTDPNEATDVIIDGCDLTSIKQVYGGGNAASTPANLVRINEAYEIHEAFGGGNGKDAYEKGGKWYENLGANVGYYATYHSDTTDNEKGTQGNPYPAVANDDADTPEERRANTSYHYGKGTANLIITGGRVHTTYGGSNTKGNVRAEVHTSTEDAGVCDLLIDKSYPAGKNADTDAGSKVEAKCVDYQGAIYGGAENANVYSDVVIDVTNGTYGAIYGGNDRSGQIYGSVTINVHEEGCKPIVIGKLYAGGYNADYSIYGYYQDAEDGNKWKARTKAQYDQLSEVEKAKITVQRDPQINIISATRIGKIYGGGYQAKLIGNPSVNVNMEKGFIATKYASDTKFDPGKHSVTEHDMDCSYEVEKREDGKAILAIGTIGTIYGGGYKGDVQGDTRVEIGTGEWLNFTSKRETTDADGKVYTYNSETNKWDWTKTVDETTTSGTVDDKPIPARNAATILGNVFGGGEGEAKESGDRAFFCESAMVGVDGDGLTNPAGGTSVVIANGTVGTLDNNDKLVAGTGNVYGGGEIGRVEKNTVVTIGEAPLENATEYNSKFTPTIYGSVFGAGKGVPTHGYSALVRGNSTVTIQGLAKVGESVYGGGEVATVGRYNVVDDKPTTPAGGGICTVTVKDDAEIGPDDMVMTKADGPDDAGHVFGAGKGATPFDGFEDSEDPWHVDNNNAKVTHTDARTNETAKTAYLDFIETLGLASETHVTIGGNAFVKGSVYGGAENGYVQTDTHVTIQGDCQIGNGYAQMADDGTYLSALATPVTPIGVNRRYTADEWAQGKLIPVDSDPADLKTLANTYYKSSLPECASWPYQSPFDAHDKFANATDDLDKYSDGTSTEGGRRVASDGHTFYGNVFGGGSGYYPYAPGKWHFKAGSVGGDTYVNITGGHILTSIYGGNEMTNVTGDTHVTFGGTATLGVPRTLGQIAAHPVTCYLFGGGKGDQRVFFNMQTNVKNVNVDVTGGTIYGSVFGGGEDGHVLGNVTMNIGTAAVGTEGQEDYVAAAGPTIGTWGTSYVEGNVFGGGRGFAGDALTAGVVCGNVNMNIKGGTMLGSIYGGGRLGSIGTHLEPSNHANYGKLIPDNRDENYETGADYVHEGSTHGYVTINISGGTIGNNNEYIIPQVGNIPGGLGADPKNWETDDWTAWKTHNNVPNTDYVYDEDLGFVRLTHTKGGNVFAGAMGRMFALDGTTPLNRWYDLGMVKSTRLTITGGTIKSNVYGGGELGWTAGKHKHSNTALTATDSLSTEILIQDGTIGTEVKEAGDVTRYTFGSVYGGGYGNATEALSDDTNPKFIAGRVVGGTSVKMEGGQVKGSIFGGGEVANVGLGFYSYKSTITGGTKGGFTKDDSGITAADIAKVSTYVDVSGGTVGIAPVAISENLTRHFGGATMGNVYGGGSGNRTIVRCGLVLGNSNVSISQAEGKTTRIYHNVYGGGSFGSVGDYEYESHEDPDIHTEKVYGVQAMHTAGTGEATVSITGGTIGSNGHENGMVFGSSRGDIANPHSRDNYMAWVNNATVTIGTEGGTYASPTVKGSVYGSGENGHTFGNTVVTVNSGTVGVPSAPVVVPDPSAPDNPEKATTYYGANYPFRGNVYGGGCGTDTYVENNEVKYNPEAGIVRGNTTVNINGGLIAHSVYGAGSMGSVGTITNLSDTTAVAAGGTGLARHADETNGFALSWPYEFKFAENTGKATVNINGGHIGVQLTDGNIEIKGDGDVYGSARGEAGDRYKTAHLALVKETEVNVNFPDTCTATFANYSTDLGKWCVTGSVHGSGENGYVYGDTHVTLNKGLVGHSLYGAGKGSGTYTKALNKISGEGTYDAKIYSLIAGKVMGNTYVTMNGGRVGRNVYGGGNMGSVGKGNYAGGTDDYVNDNAFGAVGYGEKIDGELWTKNPTANTNAWYFQNSGKATVKVFGGIVGYIDEEDPTKSTKGQLPYGNVFGGSAGEAAPNVADNPSNLYLYSPAFFSGYVNETDVTIGGGYRCTTACTISGKAYKVGDSVTADEYNAFTDGKSYWTAITPPTIYASVYGGGQDGHVRRDTKVTVLGGEIGVPYTSDNQTLLQTDNLDSPQWLHRGNIYGGGSGITKYKFDLDGDGKTDKNDSSLIYNGKPFNEEDYSTSSGSVTRFTEVNVKGGTIHRNVYGGGSMGSIGAPKMGQTYLPYKKGDTAEGHGVGKQSQNTVNIGGGTNVVTIGTPYENGWSYNKTYGGEVYGACRGLSTLDADQFSTSIWTQVNIKDKATIMGNVYGGGDNGKVKKDTEVRIGDQ